MNDHHKAIATQVGHRLTAARKRTGMPQQELARRLDVAPQSLLNWEKGHYEVTLVHLIRLAQELHVSIDWLAYGYKHLLAMEKANFCKNGHAYDEVGVYFREGWKTGRVHRRCNRCEAIRKQNQRARRKEQALVCESLAA